MSVGNRRQTTNQGLFWAIHACDDDGITFTIPRNSSGSHVRRRGLSPLGVIPGLFFCPTGFPGGPMSRVGMGESRSLRGGVFSWNSVSEDCGELEWRGWISESGLFLATLRIGFVSGDFALDAKDDWPTLRA